MKIFTDFPIVEKKIFLNLFSSLFYMIGDFHEITIDDQIKLISNVNNI